ncbi:4-methyl-5(b-hydroxyethyl)-thiazole monophosphate biosynthesis [Bacteroides luti]|uniref:4-methyl-5(B-hydroxyethyl)-thiazole monophosphate biosynthesis n=1 Tax=Bacteroides luti TaxID=1297750 RepID=A0A1M5DT41_9BACE|nr:DJ-1/PfpI family protein [Bacteroides luti]SHF70129.1 4-methyl-5(b-hydroxyethyl)-thiazole monophosphate biosynthesis [Bacteroides luti]
MAKKVLLFLAQGFEAYEASVFTDVFGWSREVGFEPVDLITTGLRSEVKCYWNLVVKPELPFSEINIEDYDALAIPGGAGEAGFYEDAYDERFLNLIREFNRRGKLIASICVAALPIAKSGVLNQRNATTWDLNNGVRRKQLADFCVKVQDEQLVVDNNIITSTGPATSLDVAFKLLEMLTSIESVNEVKTNMRFIQ